uniref:NADH:ubiquinone oxidoreductase complex assembly factor 2 n=1 Tax=Pavo cristatus TaxID=9049 RepID=A0A8C9L794_PAVCR
MGRAWQALRALRLRLLGPEKELVGTDQFGNKYYRVPQYQTGQEHRQVLLAECTNHPSAWEHMVRDKRQTSVFSMEILKNENYRQEMKQKVKDMYEKDKLLQTKEYKEGLVAEPVHTQVKGHASAPYYGKKEPSQDPTSTASTFQPGSWMPPGSDSSEKK